MADQIPGNGNVQIEFEGLMVGRYNESARFYEIGMLPAPMHALKVSYTETMQVGESGSGLDGSCYWSMSLKEIAGINRHWNLKVEGEEANASRYLASDGARGTWEFNRTCDPAGLSLSKQKDFRWILDLETEFPEHRGVLPIRRDMITPILRVKNGQFYTTEILNEDVGAKRVKYKTTMSGTYQEFGYAGGVATVDLNVPANRAVLLNVAGSTEGQDGAEILRLPIRADAKYVIKFENLPPTPPTGHEHQLRNGERTHFQFFYMLFGVPPSNWYEFAPDPPSGIDPLPHHHLGGEEAAAEHMAAHAVVPSANRDDEVGVPSPYRCGLGHLSRRTEPLV
jgi:hypothetical protein